MKASSRYGWPSRIPSVCASGSDAAECDSSKKTYGAYLTPEAALEKQLERYRQMTGEERLKIALDLHAFACEVAREGIRGQYPTSDEQEIDRRLRQRLEAAYQ